MIWFVLGCVGKFGHFHIRSFLAPGVSKMSTPDDAYPLHEESCPGLHDLHIGWVLQAAVTSVGQIYLCGSWASGLFMIVGSAVCSRIMALSLFLGALGGVLFALALAAPCGEIEFGL